MELEVLWQEHELDSYLVIIVTWEDAMRGAPGKYIDCCEVVLYEFTEGEPAPYLPRPWDDAFAVALQGGIMNGVLTARELLEHLKTLDAENLDKPVMVIHDAEEGYYPASHASVLHNGFPVVHVGKTASQAQTSQPDFWGDGSEEAVTVDPADLRAVWKIMGDVQLGPSHSIDSHVFERVCSPGADVKAVWFRAAMLQLLSAMLSAWVRNGEFTDAVFKVAATFPMKKMAVGVPQQGPPFDVQEFIAQVAAS